MSNPASGKAEDEAAFLGELGRRVRHARHSAGLTRRQLAARSGLSERYLAQLEAGEGNISVLLIRRVARVLHTDLQRLVGEPDAGDGAPGAERCPVAGLNAMQADAGG